MSKRSRDKGGRGEREVAELLRPLFPNVRRRVSGEERQDERPGRDIVGMPGWCVQVNLSERPSPTEKLLEAQSAADPDERPIAFTRRCSAKHPGGEWLITMRAADFLDVFRIDELTRRDP